jgi:ABC-type dipeptide/oligopeptide/nickel transport system permease subunit
MGAVKSRMGNKGITSGEGNETGFMQMRGRTQEQKKVIKYFNSTGLLGMIFRISNSTFDAILDSKIQAHSQTIEKRALAAHGMDADEVKEIPPVRVENYYTFSRYFKMFRDLTFRASEYQMSYLMFSEKQMYAYCHTFDLTTENTTVQTREYFYEDITAIDVTQRNVEYMNPRSLMYILGGIGAVILGLILCVAGMEEVNAIVSFIGVCFVIAGLVVGIFMGYSRSIVKTLVLRLTVAGDEFICAMKPENIVAIQGMKAKLREKKK